jgi:uncharacterized RDD family membrane protein YckC
MEPLIKETDYLDSNISSNPVCFRLAGFWIRLWAFLADLAIIGMSSHILFKLLWPAGLQEFGVTSFFLINPLFPGILGALYLTIMTAIFGQTLGKMIFGIKVIQKDGSAPGWTTSVMRELIGRTLSQLLGSNLGYLVCAFHPRKQALHDILIDTMVVYTDSQQQGKWVKL